MFLRQKNRKDRNYLGLPKSIMIKLFICCKKKAGQTETAVKETVQDVPATQQDNTELIAVIAAAIAASTGTSTDVSENQPHNRGSFLVNEQMVFVLWVFPISKRGTKTQLEKL